MTEPNKSALRTLSLTGDEAERVVLLSDSIAKQRRREPQSVALQELVVLGHDLPVRIRRFMTAARLDGEGHVIRITGNMVDQAALGTTPKGWESADTPASSRYAAMAMLYSGLLGDLIGWASQQAGRLVTDVLPSQEAEDSTTSGSSRRELAWHTEDAHSPHRADWVGLLALRSTGVVPTTISYLDPDQLSPDVLDVLTQPRFTFAPDSSHDPSKTRPSRGKILSGSIDQPVLRADRDFLLANEGDLAAEAALRTATRQLDENVYDVVLEAGDMVFIDNRNAVHGRRAFRAEYDGTDRWLKRVNVVRDLRRTRPGRTSDLSRVIE